MDYWEPEIIIADPDPLLKVALKMLAEEHYPQPLNLMDEPLTEARLPKPLRPLPFHPHPPPRRRQQYRKVWREFDPVPPPRIRTSTPSDISDLFDDQRADGIEKVRGRRFVKWRTIKGLGVNNTPTMMANLSADVNTAFYLQHTYSYQLRNIENGDTILHYKNHGSPWFNILAEAGK